MSKVGRVVRRTSLALFAAATASASLAQAPALDRQPNDVAAQAMHRFAMCVGMRRDGAGRVLATIPESHNERLALRRLVDPMPDCELGGMTLAFRPRYLRGGLAEALWRADFGGSRSKKAPIVVFAVPPAEAAAKLSSGERGEIGLVVFAECVARADIESVKAVLAERVGSVAERLAFPRLQDAMDNCLPEGKSLQLTPLRLRGYLAEGAYRASTPSNSEIR